MACDLHFKTHNVVPGEGPAPARVMVVGEAPGDAEDRKGRPFYGPSGVRLSVLLKLAGLNRDEVYVTNIVKHRPHDTACAKCGIKYATETPPCEVPTGHTWRASNWNRKPRAAEIKACAGFLHSEIAAVRPRVIILLGDTAVKWFDKTISLRKDHGWPRPWNETMLVPNYHPAASMYNPSLWPLMLEDFRAFESRLEATPLPEPNYGLATDMAAAKAMSRDPLLMGFDLESTSTARAAGVQRAEVVGYSVSDAPGQAVYVPEKPGQIVRALSHHTPVVHNAKFEWVKLHQLGIELNNFEDTKLAAYLLGYPSTGLKDLTRHLLGRDPITYEQATTTYGECTCSATTAAIKSERSCDKESTTSAPRITDCVESRPGPTTEHTTYGPRGERAPSADVTKNIAASGSVTPCSSASTACQQPKLRQSMPEGVKSVGALGDCASTTTMLRGESGAACATPVTSPSPPQSVEAPQSGSSKHALTCLALKAIRRDMSEIPPEEIVDYAAADSDHTLQLWNVLAPEMDRMGVRDVYERIEKPLIPILAKAELRGVLVDRPAALRAKAFFTARAASAQRRAREAGLPVGVSIGSRDQLATWLESMGAPIKARTPVARQLRTDFNTLVQVQASGWEPELMSAITDFFDMRRLREFPAKFLSLSVWDGALHGNINQAGHMEEEDDSPKASPSTGRLSMSGPNLQQVPHHGRGKGEVYEKFGQIIRASLVARPGYVLVAADFAQQEPRVLAYVSGETQMQADFDAGIPIYAPMGEAIYGYPVDKTMEVEWHVAKTFFLAKTYGADWQKLLEIDPHLTREQAQVADAAVTVRYPGLAQFGRKVALEIREHGYARDYFGRIRWFPGVFSPQFGQRAAADREAVNMYIQGPGASITKLGLIAANTNLRSLEAYFLLPVHDELIFEAVERDVAAAAEVLRDMSADIMPVPMPVEIKVGPNLGEMESYGHS
jgi:DNA polymerase I-like protein with 3'-5' exonuclease and polymerase domains/uracil-DNA glycosylase